MIVSIYCMFQSLMTVRTSSEQNAVPTVDSLVTARVSIGCGVSHNLPEALLNYSIVSICCLEKIFSIKRLALAHNYVLFLATNSFIQSTIYKNIHKYISFLKSLIYK